MRYTVVWTPQARGHLANLWMAATNRQALSDAANRIDRALRDDPDTKGSPFGRFFIREDRPLAALYEIIAADRLARVLTAKIVT